MKIFEISKILGIFKDSLGFFTKVYEIFGMICPSRGPWLLARLENSIEMLKIACTEIEEKHCSGTMKTA